MSRVVTAHLEAEMRRLRLLLGRRVRWLRHQWKHHRAEDYQGVAISDFQADQALAGGASPEAEARFYGEDAEAVRIQEEIAEAEAQAAVLRRAGGDAGLPIDRLVHLFGLTAFDCDTLWLCLAPELDASFGLLYAYVQDDVHRRHATPYLALSLFAEAGRRQEALTRFSPGAPLRSFRLASVEEGPTAAAPFGSRPLRLESRIADYLQGVDRAEERLAQCLRPLPQGWLPETHEDCLERLAAESRAVLEAGGSLCVNLTGREDSGKRLLARALGQRLGREVLALDPLRVPGSLPEREDFVALLEREAKLLNLACYVRAPESDPAEKAAAAWFTDLLQRLSSPLIVDSPERWPAERSMVVAAVPKPERAAQVEIWKNALGSGVDSLEGAIEAVVEQFDVGPETIQRAAEEARRRAGCREDGRVTAADLWQACREQTGWRLEDLAQRITPCYQWDDIVLPEDAARQLREIAAQVAYRAQVYERWGFGARLSRGRGISALFSGPSGTGKTMAAEILANHLQLGLYRIDLAGVVSKYIGETEKNLRRIFDAAEQSGAILFFDEADALFGKRTEVKDSHDRYANIEINFLLQRMEEYRGLAILATNRKSALDRAFLRRLRFLVDFPVPGRRRPAPDLAKSFSPGGPCRRLGLRLPGPAGDHRREHPQHSA